MTRPGQFALREAHTPARSAQGITDRTGTFFAYGRTKAMNAMFVSELAAGANRTAHHRPRARRTAMDPKRAASRLPA